MSDKKTQRGYLKNFPAGVAVGSSLGFCLAAVFDTNVQTSFQSFAAHLLPFFGALFAAAYALSGPLAEIEHQKELEKQRRHREEVAATATLPIKLFKLEQSSRKIAQIMLKQWESNEYDNFPLLETDAGPLIEETEKILQSFEDIMRSSQVNRVSKAISFLTNQVLFQEISLSTFDQRDENSLLGPEALYKQILVDWTYISLFAKELRLSLFDAQPLQNRMLETSNITSILYEIGIQDLVPFKEVIEASSNKNYENQGTWSQGILIFDVTRRNDVIQEILKGS